MDMIQAEMRNPSAKAKQLRRLGIIPCVIDGAKLKESLSVQIDQNTARQLQRTKRSGSIVDVQADGKTYHTLIKQLDYNTLSNTITHICFHILDADKKVNSIADIVLLNKDKVQGVLEQMQLRIPHAAKPEYLLDTVAVDLEHIPVGTTLTVGDIPAFQSDKIELQVDPASIVLRISDKKHAGTENTGDAADGAEA